MTTANAMSIELVKILEAAQAYFEKSMKYYALMESAETEEMKNIYWARCNEYDGNCQGLICAYGIITGKHILRCEIKKELTLA